MLSPKAGAVFEAAEWKTVGVAKCDVAKGVFAGGRLHDVVFAESSLGGSAWRNIALDHARFIGCVLDEAAFSDVTMTRGLVVGGRCARARVERGTWSDTSLLDMNVEATAFVATALANCDFGDCSGAGPRFTEAATLEGCQFRRCKTPGLTVAGTIRDSAWTTCDLGDAALAAATFEGVAFRECRFSAAAVLPTSCAGTDFARSVLAGVDMARRSFAAADFGDADLTAANCTEADFTGASLARAVAPRTASLAPQRMIA